LTAPQRSLGELVSLSPDGTAVAYNAAAGAGDPEQDLFLLPTDGTTATAVLTGPSSDSVVGWSRDGRHLIFRSDRPGSRGHALWALPIAQGKPAGEPVVVKPDFNGSPLGITVDGDVFYEALTSGPRETTLFVATVDPEQGRVVQRPQPMAHDRTALNLAPRWSGDGKWFMYWTQRGESRVISIRSNESGVVRELPRKLTYLWTFDFSPDGRTIVCRGTSQGREGIFLIDAQTGDMRTIVLKDGPIARAGGVGYYQPRFVDEGRKVQYFKNDFGAGVVQEIDRDLATGTERVLVESRVDLMAPRRGIGLGRSPDEKLRLVLHTQPATALTVENVGTGASREVFRLDRPDAVDANGGIQWTPDSRALIARVAGAAANERTLWWIPVDGRPAHQIDLGRSDIVDTGIAIHPDGRQIAFVAGDPIVSKTSQLQSEFRWIRSVAPGVRRK
jgi:Tol biopolymer transport system component